LYFDFPREFNEQSSTLSPYYHSLEGQCFNFPLSKWIDDCKNLVAGDTGCGAFTNTTMKAVENQLEKVEHAEDPNNIDIFIQIPAGKASSHGLSKWQSKHP
jgi:hypothetical protein